MYTQYAAVDNRCQVQVVEDLAAALPDVGIAVLVLAFVVEAVHLCDLSRFVVASEESDAVWPSGLHCHE